MIFFYILFLFPFLVASSTSSSEYSLNLTFGNYKYLFFFTPFLYLFFNYRHLIKFIEKYFIICFVLIFYILYSVLVLVFGKELKFILFHMFCFFGAFYAYVNSFNKIIYLIRNVVVAHLLIVLTFSFLYRFFDFSFLFSKNYIDYQNLFFGFFQSNSGLFFNNNLFGSVFSLLIPILIFSGYKFKKIDILLLFPLLLSGNATVIFILLICFLIILFKKYGFFVFYFIIASIIPISSYLFFFPQKIISASIKINILLENLFLYFSDINYILIGGIAPYSESSLVDFLMYYGLIFFIISISFIFILCSNFNYKLLSFIIIFLFVCLIQNSALTPINGFLFGLSLVLFSRDKNEIYCKI